VPIETLPGRKAETDCKGISEGFRLAKSERAVPGGDGAQGYATPPSVPGESSPYATPYCLNQLCSRFHPSSACSFL
jgi:hypothetical protein